MALIKCPECGKEISDQASSCPNCGCPISISNNQQPHHTKEPKRGGCLKTIFIFFVICIGAIIAVIYSKKQLDGTQSKKEPDEIQSKKEFEESQNNIETESDEDIKENAKFVDEQLWAYVLPIINSHNQLMKIVGNESSTILDIYNAAKYFKEMCRQTWSDPPEVSGNGADEYLKTCKDYITVEQTMAESLLKYTDSKKTSDLSKVQDNIKYCNEAIIVLAKNRGIFLTQNGFSNEEIQELENNLGIEE